VLDSHEPPGITAPANAGMNGERAVNVLGKKK
jgi:hypothetical protein